MKRPVRVETPIHPINPIHSWEKLPEYMDTQRFARHLGYIFASLPRARRRALEVPLTRVTQGISMTICALNIEGEGEGADQVRRTPSGRCGRWRSRASRSCAAR